MGGRLSQIPPRQGNCVSECYDGSCQKMVQQHHNKILNATDFHPGDINLRKDKVDENEAICDELARHYAQHELKDPEGYFDSEDEEVQMILGRGYDIPEAGQLCEAEGAKDKGRHS